MKREDLPLVTPAQFRKFKPCWLETEDGRARYERVASQRPEWNALDVLDLEDVSVTDRLWAVLHEEFLPPMLLHEFGCRCAEFALSLVKNPDARSVEAIRVKRRWMNGDATDDELRFARDEAFDAESMAARAASWSAAQAAARSAEWSAAQAAARSAEWSAAQAAAWAAEGDVACSAEGDAAWAMEKRTAAREQEIDMLRTLIDEWGGEA